MGDIERLTPAEERRVSNAIAESERQEATRIFHSLHVANAERQKLWGGGSQGPLYRATELAGEIGEVCNIVKKLERERLGLVGSRATLEQLADELGDGLICLSLLALEYGIDLDAAAARKFNKTSDKLGFPIKVSDPA
jgi:NTP pyrophosphatase (non-canonical NTP hydrolase)